MLQGGPLKLEMMGLEQQACTDTGAHLLDPGYLCHTTIELRCPTVGVRINPRMAITAKYQDCGAVTVQAGCSRAPCRLNQQTLEGKPVISPALHGTVDGPMTMICVDCKGRQGAPAWRRRSCWGQCPPRRSAAAPPPAPEASPQMRSCP